MHTIFSLQKINDRYLVIAARNAEMITVASDTSIVGVAQQYSAIIQGDISRATMGLFPLYNAQEWPTRSFESGYDVADEEATAFEELVQKYVGRFLKPDYIILE
ncbi:hypothetical protein HYU11_02350 [Candidatus Woesearchaeota archaeon]|nr:hypothetical protein [Candidatus Woesearchaeota archaeon]